VVQRSQPRVPSLAAGPNRRSSQLLSAQLSHGIRHHLIHLRRPLIVEAIVEIVAAVNQTPLELLKRPVSARKRRHNRARRDGRDHNRRRHSRRCTGCKRSPVSSCRRGRRRCSSHTCTFVFTLTLLFTLTLRNAFLYEIS
jgi:hypothetical protein